MKFLVGILLLLFTACSQTAPVYRFSVQYMGLFDTYLQFIAYVESEDIFDSYATGLLYDLERYHQLFDIFNAYEGINNLHTVNENAGVSPVEVDFAIIELLLAGKEAYDLTDGALNIMLGPVLEIWHYHRRGRVGLEPTLPDMANLTQASALSRINGLVINTEDSTVFLTEVGMSIDIGALGKGFAVGRVMEEIKASTRIESALISVGGHVVAHNAPPDRGFWGVGVQNPDNSPNAPATIDAMDITYGVVAVSGGYERYFTVDDMQFSHIINPATLMPANHFQQIAIWHENSVMSEILSTALFIMPFEEGFALAQAVGGEVLWVDSDGYWAYTPGYVGLSRELRD